MLAAERAAPSAMLRASSIPVTDSLPPLTDPNLERFYNRLKSPGASGQDDQRGLLPPTASSLPPPLTRSPAPMSETMPDGKPAMMAGVDTSMLPPPLQMQNPSLVAQLIRERLAMPPQGANAVQTPSVPVRAASPLRPSAQDPQVPLTRGALPQPLPNVDPNSLPAPPAPSVPLSRLVNPPPAYSTAGMDPLQRAMTKLSAMQNARPQDKIEETSQGVDVVPMMRHMGRKQGALTGAGRGALQGLANGGPLGALFGALTGATVGAVSPGTIETADQQRRVGRQEQIVNSQFERQGSLAKLEDLRAQAHQRNADADYTAARPGLELSALQQKYDQLGSEEKRAFRQNLVSMVNSTDEFDPDGADKQMADAFRAAGLPVPPKKTKGSEYHLVHDEGTGQTYRVAIDKGSGKSSTEALSGPDGKPLVTQSPTQVSATERGADRRLRASEGDKNRQNQRDLVGLRGDRKANRDYQEAQNLVNQFNKLTVDASKARLSRQRDTILATRDNVESNLKSRFPDIIELDDKGKPSRLKARTPASGGAPASGSKVVPLTAAPGQKSITDYAQKHSMSVEEARRKFEADGWTVQ